MTLERLVLVPELEYADLAAVITGLGWEFVSGPAHPLVVAGEPEFATWRRGPTASLVYTCNPVARLRVLDLSHVDHPADRLALTGRLPPLGSDRIAQLLRAGEAESVLLGVLAVDALAGREHLRAVRALMHHPNRTVARAAQHATVRLAN